MPADSGPFPIVLETQRLQVRQWVQDDWKRFRVLATDPRVMRHIGDGSIWPDGRIRRFVDGGIEQSVIRGWVLWPVICRDDSEFIGICGFNAGYPPDVEIGWWLRPEYWGRGLATEAATAVLGYGFQRFDFPRVISVARADNAASIRVMEKLGMIRDQGFEKDGIELVRYVLKSPVCG